MIEEQVAPDPSALHKLAVESLSAVEYRKRYCAIDYFKPYSKQIELFELGATKRERFVMSANQVGKSVSAAVEVSYHLTGRYPKGWQGRRFDHPVKIWVTSETATVLRDVDQRLLFGEPGVKEAFGSGTVPLELIVDVSTSRGITDAYDTCQVRHSSGGISTVSFRSYQAGRQAFQGVTIHFIVFDEPPPIDVYSEGLTRVTAVGGFALTVFTPMTGSGEVVRRFTDEVSTDRAMVNMTLYDASVHADGTPGHMTPERIEEIKRNCLPHELQTRVYGQPMQGSGSVFPIDEAQLKEPAIVDVPPHWYKIWGIDFGIGHPFAAVLVLWDKDADCVHVHRAIRVKDQTPLQHAAAMKPIGQSVPIAWPQDGAAREAGSGQSLISQYKQQELRVLPSHATHATGGYSTEAGILDMWQRMSTGRFKVAAELSEWFQEFRSYHRKDGLIVKVYDDLMSASRIACMSLRFAKQVALGRGLLGHRDRGFDNSAEGIAARSDFDVHDPYARQVGSGSISRISGEAFRRSSPPRQTQTEDWDVFDAA